MPPRFPSPVTIRTPAGFAVDPVSGNERPLPPIVEQTTAYLAQQPVGEASSQTEQLASQHTVISLWTLLVRPSTTLTSDSTVTDTSGRTFQVVGQVADRPHHRPTFRAAAVRLISDMQ